ncbi:MAG: hypothetical protein FD161_75 [Limisphaerales bacterium]|nr:MAG: hypothetical protein FD161_75 [Limisphaerales bacterium]KAG0510521.1 MAG: hypothetical protein E1N63_75 [Limisphaerales bacterium]TXT52794.1 MAG: hypothetical protein FD140_337 [Limisphaerales bacterium]
MKKPPLILRILAFPFMLIALLLLLLAGVVGGLILGPVLGIFGALALIHDMFTRSDPPG